MEDRRMQKMMVASGARERSGGGARVEGKASELQIGTLGRAKGVPVLPRRNTICLSFLFL
jgi:hypothetical protein